MFVVLLPIFFMIFMVFFPLFWALAICGCWFLPLTKFSKVLISVLILAMLCGGIAFLFFDDEYSIYPFLFACGFISLPVFLRYFWRRQESYEKYYHIIHTNTLAKNNLKRRAISLFSIGLLGTFMILWQVEVPQKIVFDIAKKALKTKVMKEVFIENIDENETFFTATKTLLDCEDKNIACPFFSFKYPIYDIKALTDGKVRIDGKVVGRIYGIAYSTSTLTRFLTGFDYTKRLRYFTNISK
ncbi:MAG: hypothetical protein MR964_03795 [Campylobacter sp.]|uniref:hypothetical protein n=1 Tax=Campylobacter sp. TaxID=205 RepID=UPI002AA720C7|nr:hypothetical protein [Campylobacter sp.]MCI7023336.1 hypothetical protein [Campylobacter sp.]